MSNVQRKLLAFCISWVPICESFSQEMKTDRPDLTESAATLYKNFIQLEAGWQSGTIKSATQTEKSVIAPTVLVRIGLIDRIELRLAGQHLSGNLENTHFKGFGDFEAGFKIQCFENKKQTFVFGVLNHLIIPSGDLNTSGQEYKVVNKLLFNHVLDHDISVEYNLGYTSGKDDAFTYTLAVGKSIVTNLAAFVETFGEYNGQNGWEVNMDTGLTYLVHKDIQFDISYGLGLNHSMHYLAAGISWRFNTNGTTTNLP